MSTWASILQESNLAEKHRPASSHVTTLPHQPIFTTMTMNSSLDQVSIACVAINTLTKVNLCCLCMGMQIHDDFDGSFSTRRKRSFQKNVYLIYLKTRVQEIFFPMPPLKACGCHLERRSKLWSVSYIHLETGSSWVYITLQEFSSHEVCYRVSYIAGLSVSFVREVWGKCKPFICFLTLLSFVANDCVTKTGTACSAQIRQNLEVSFFHFIWLLWSGLTVIELGSRSRGAVGSLCCIFQQETWLSQCLSPP